MKALRTLLPSCIFLLLFASCGLLDSSEESNPLIDLLNNNDLELTEERIQKYIKTHEKLREFGIGFVEAMNDGNLSLASLDGYNEFLSIIKEGGFSGLEEFVKTNARVAWAYNVAKGESGMGQFAKIQSDSEQLIKDALADGDVSEEVKAQLREQLKQLQDNYQHNSKYADYSLTITRKLTSKEDIALIRKYEKKLDRTFTGMEIPKVPEMPKWKDLKGE